MDISIFGCIIFIILRYDIRIVTVHKFTKGEGIWEE